MLYEKYEKKIKRIAKVKNGIHKIRFVLISIAAVIFLAASAFVVGHGRVTSNVTFSKSLTYGDEYTVSATALFSDVSYEYRKVGDTDWTKEKPYLAGDYECRVISDTWVGSKYSTPVKYTISPKLLEFTTETTTLTYGSTPTLVAKGLVYGDKFSGATFTTEPTITLSGSVTIDEIKVENNGLDVTNCYKFEKQSFSLTYTPLVINLSPRSVQMVYNGNKLEYDNSFITDQELNSTDSLLIQVEYYNEAGELVDDITTVGTYKVKIIVSTVTNSKGDVTGNYNLICQETEFVVSKRPIVFVTDTDSKTYDGTPLVDKDYTISNDSPYQLVEGHTSKVVSATELVNATTIDNELDIHIYDKSGNDITNSLYEVTYIKGSLTVNPKEITITTPNDEKEYDGMSFENTNATAPLADGDSFVCLTKSDILNVGEKDNICSYDIYNSNEEKVTGNYTVSYSYGKLNIKPRTVHVTPLVLSSVVYDNQVKTYPVYEGNYTMAEGSSMPAGEGLTISAVISNEKYLDAKNSGTYVVKGYDYQITNGLKGNYNIIFDATTTFEITKRPITLKYTKDDEITYSNTYYEFDPKAYTIVKDNGNESNITGDYLGYEISVGVTYSITVGDASLLDTKPINAGTYQILAASCNEELNENFIVSYALEGSTLVIKPYEVTIKPKADGTVTTYTQQEMIYEKNAYSYVGENTFFENDNISLVTDVTEGLPVDAGTYTIYIKSYEFTTGISTNYNVTTNTGTLTINRLEVSVAPHSMDTTIYDATLKSYDGKFTYVSEAHFIGEDTTTLTVTFLGLLYDVEKPINADLYHIKPKDYNHDIDKNYIVTMVDNDSYYEIKPYEITIMANADGTKEVYTQEELIYEHDTYKYVGENKFFGLDNITVITKPNETPINVGIYDLYIDSYEFTEGTISTNYIINKEVAKLEVTPLLVTIKATTYTEYYKNDYTYNPISYITVDSCFLGFDTIKNITVYYAKGDQIVTPKDVGTYEVYILNYEFDGIKEENYTIKISTDPAYLDIIRRPIKLEFIETSLEKTFDGKTYEYSNEVLNVYDVLTETYSKSNTYDDVTITFKVTYNDSFDLPFDAGTYIIKIASYCEALDKNYSVDYTDTYITFVVNPAPITLMPKSTTAIYTGVGMIYDATGYDVVEGEFFNDDTITKVDTYVTGDLLYLGQPVFVGTYTISISEYRTYFTGSNVNNYIYTTLSNELAITPKEVVITAVDSLEKTYDAKVSTYKSLGGTFDYTLVDAATIAFDVVTYLDDETRTCELLNVGTYNVKILISSVHSIGDTIYDEKLLDNYIFVEGVRPTVTIKKRTIHLEIESYSVIYYDTFTKDIYKYICIDDTSYAEGEYFTTNSVEFLQTIVVTPLNVGTYYINGLDYTCVGNSSDNYEITTYATGTLEIKKRPVTLEAYQEEYEKTYDGIEYVYNNAYFRAIDTTGADTYNELIDGTALNVVVEVWNSNYSINNIINADTYNIHVVGYTGEVLKNFEVSYSSVPFVYTVNPRPITIKVIDQSYVYTSYDIEYLNTLETGVDFVGEDNISITDSHIKDINNINKGMYSSAIFSGTYYIEIDSYVFIKGIKTNYDVTTEFATLEVTPATLDISLSSMDSVTYDGNKHDYYLDNSKTFILLPGDLATVLRKVKYSVAGEEVPQMIDAKTYTITFVDILTKGNTLYDEYFHNNYVFNVIQGEITFVITPKELTIILQDFLSERYTGEAFIYPDTAYSLGETSLVDTDFRKDKLTVEVEYLVDGEVKEPINVGTYEIHLKKAYITSFDLDTLDNYSIEYVKSTLKIDRREVTIRPLAIEDSVVFGEKYEYPKDLYEVVSGNLIEGESLEVTVYYTNAMDEVVTPYDVGTYYIHIMSHTVIGAPETSYKVDYEDNLAATLVIIPKDITIAYNPPTKKVYYDGNEYTLERGNSFVYKSSNRLVSKDAFTFLVDFYFEGVKVTPLNAKTYTAVINYESIEFSVGKKSNYNITIVESEFKLNPRPLQITPNSIEKTYDGLSEEFDSEHDFKIYDTLLKEYVSMPIRITILVNNKDISKIVNAGKYSINATAYEFTEDTYLRSNYSISYVKADYIINQRNITVTLPNLEKTFDNQGFTYDPYTLETIISNVANNESIYLTLKFIDSTGEVVDAPLHAQTYKVTLNELIEVYDQDGKLINKGTSNYNVEVVNDSTLTIKKRVLTVKTYDDEVVFNGDPYVYIQPNACVSGVYYHAIYFTVDYYNSSMERIDAPTNVGTYYMKIQENSIYYTELGGVRSEYDDYEFIIGEASTLTIKRLVVEVNVSSKDYTYDGTNNYKDNMNYQITSEIPANYYIQLQFGFGSYTYSNAPIHVGSYDIKVDDVFVYYRGNLLYIAKENFDLIIKNDDAILEITPRDLFVSGIEASITYSEKDYINDYTWYEVINLIPQDEISIKTSFTKNGFTASELKNVGIYESSFEVLGFSYSNLDDYTIWYSNGSFEITPITLIFNSQFTGEKDYDGKVTSIDKSLYTYNTSALLPGHTLEINYEALNSNGVVQDLRNADTYTFEVSIKHIENAIGEDVTENYISETYYTEKYIINPLKVIVTTGSTKYYYNGVEHVYTEGFTTNIVLPEGHKIAWDQKSETATFVTLPGIYENHVGFIVYSMVDGVMVEETHNFSIDPEETQYGTIEIMKRKVEVTSASNIDYVGTDFIKDEYNHIYYNGISKPLSIGKVISKVDLSKDDLIYGDGIDIFLMEGHTITFGRWANVNQVGIVTDNTFTLSLKIDGVTVKAEDYLDITYHYGTIELSKTILTISTVNGTCKYTDTEVELSKNVSFEAFGAKYQLSSHGEEVDYTDSMIIYKYLGNESSPVFDKYSDLWEVYENVKKTITDAGYYYIEINVDALVINGKSSYSSYRDLQTNYEFVIDSMSFAYEIKKLDVLIRTASKTVLYEGPSQILSHPSISEHIRDVQDSFDYNEYGFVSKLLEKHDFRVDESSITYCTAQEGSKENILKAVIYRKADNTDVSANYNITYDYGTLKIEKSIIVSGCILEFYNGSAHTNLPRIDCSVRSSSSYSYLSGVKVSIQTVGLYGKTPINTGVYEYEYDINTLKIEIFIDGEYVDVTEDFKGKDEYGNDYVTIEVIYLYIDSVDIYVKPKDVEFTYDGTAHYFEDYFDGEASYTLSQSLFGNERLEITTTYSYGEIKESAVINKSSAKKNYITGIKLYDENDVLVYQTHVDSKLGEMICDIDENRNYHLIYDYYSFVYYWSAQKAENNRYSKTWNAASYIINKRDLHVKTYSKTEVYSGTKFSYDSEDAFDYVDLERDLVPGHSIKVNAGKVYVPTAAGAITADNKITFIITYKNGTSTKDVSSNYNIFYDELGTISVTPVDIVIKVGSAKKSYDGTALECKSYEIISGSLLGEDSIYEEMLSYYVKTATGATKLIYVGTATNTIVRSTIHIRNSAKKEVTKCYNITIIDGELEITFAT